MRTLRVFVYRNLHTGGFSLREKSTGRVIAHAKRFYLRNATFKVSQAGRKRVLKTKCKNVHAGIEGELVFEPPIGTPYGGGWQRVRYNPYKQKEFSSLGVPVTHADLVSFWDDVVYIPAST